MLDNGFSGKLFFMLSALEVKFGDHYEKVNNLRKNVGSNFSEFFLLAVGGIVRGKLKIGDRRMCFGRRGQKNIRDPFWK